MDCSKPTILIVDDYEMNLKLAEFALKNEYNVLLSESGKDALDILNNDSVDLILLDIMMPEMDGFETYDNLRKLDAHKDTPVCFLTGDTDEDSIKKMAELKIPFIGKPFVPAKLIEMVNSLLQ